MINAIDTIHTIREVPDDALLLFDLDNTLMTPITHFGSERWEMELRDQYRKQGLSAEEAAVRSTLEWEAAQQLTDMQAVEEVTLDLVRDWALKLKMAGLTARGKRLQQITEKQLKQAGYCPTYFHRHFPTDRQFCDRAFLRNGVIYCEGSCKGTAFRNLLQAEFEEHPGSVIAFDDRYEHLLAIREVATELGVEAHLYHYQAVENGEGPQSATQW